MKIIILAQDVSAQQWLGRLVNEAALTPESYPEIRIHHVHSLDEALSQADSDHCMTIVWSSAVRGLDLARIPDFPGHLVLINESNGQDRFFLDHSNGTHIFEHDLDAPRLRELMLEFVHG